MIPPELQNVIVKKVTDALKDHNLGLIVMRPNDGSLVIYINDIQSATQDAFRLATGGPQGGS